MTDSVVRVSTGYPGPTGPPGPLGDRIVQIQVTDPNGAVVAAGTGKAYFRVNALLDGWKLSAVAAAVTNPSSSGKPTVQIVNMSNGSVAMLSTPVSIDITEKDSKTAAVPAVVDVANRVVHEADEIRLDVTIGGTGALGLIVDLTFTA